MLLFDLPAWRRENCHQMIIDTLERNQIKMNWPDQNLLNNAIPERLLKPLPLKYNYVTHIYEPEWERKVLHTGNVYTEEEIEEAMQHPAIIHYLGGKIMTRPWYKECHSSQCEAYYRYKALSPWKDAPLLPNVH